MTRDETWAHIIQILIEAQREQLDVEIELHRACRRLVT
jgi:hypothetical protein